MMFACPQQIDTVERFIDDRRVAPVSPGSHQRGRDIAGAGPHGDTSRFRHKASLTTVYESGQSRPDNYNVAFVNSGDSGNSDRSGDRQPHQFRMLDVGEELVSSDATLEAGFG